MNIQKLGIGAATAAAVGVMILGAASFANADDTSPSATSRPRATAGARAGNAGKAGKGGPGGMAGHGHTDATADEAAKVTAAVLAKDAAVTVTKVMKDDDGSFDVMGTKDNAPVMVEVSADLATIEVRTGGPGGPGKSGHGGRDGQGRGPGMGQDGTGTSKSSTAPSSAATT